MQSESQPSGSAAHEPVSPEHAPSPSLSRKFAWAMVALLVAATVAAAIWAVRAWQTNRAIANVESSIAGRPLPPAGVSATTAGAAAGATSPGTAAEPLRDMPSAPPSADRLPPLLLPGQRVPAAVLRDLPEWVAAEVAPVQTSGASGDESAALAPQRAPAVPREERPRSAAPDRPDRYGAVFARCPGPGESGAVECRRAICAGAARKAAACAPYLE